MIVERLFREKGSLALGENTDMEKEREVCFHDEFGKNTCRV